MSKIYLGNKYNGWQVDDDNKVLSLIQPLSFYDKMKKHEKIIKINFDDIDNIVVGWTNNPLPWGDNLHFIVLELTTYSKKIYNFEGTKNDITKKQFKEAIILLKNNNIKFKDKYDILNTIITSDKGIWEILNDAELLRREIEK